MNIPIGLLALSIASLALAVEREQIGVKEGDVQEEGEALTQEQWAARFHCNNFIEPALNETLKQHLKSHNERSSAISSGQMVEQITKLVPWYHRISFSVMNQCNRDQQAWRFLYIDELQSDSFNYKVRDHSIDERYSNLIYDINLHTMSDWSFFKLNSGDEREDQLNELRVAGGQVDGEQCARDLEEMSQQVDEFAGLLSEMRARNTSAAGGHTGDGLDERFVRLARVLDSFGRYESGSLSGRGRFVGDYTECMKTSLSRRAPEAASDDRLIGMRFCWAKFPIENSVSWQLKRRRRLDQETADLEIATGVCLPRSCHTHTLRRHKQLVQKFINTQLVFPAAMFVDQERELDSIFCLVDGDSQAIQMPTSGKLCLVFLCMWTLACLLATYLRHNEGQLRRTKARPAGQSLFVERAAKCLDLRDSWLDFTSDQRLIKPTDQVQLDTLNLIKILCALYCVASHCILMHGAVSAKLPEFVASVELSRTIMTALTTSHLVDTFYVISAMLTTYIMSKKLAAGYGLGAAAKVRARTRRALLFAANWLLLAAYRWLRIVPLYALMWWFRRDALTYLGSGPLWDYGLNRDTPAGACLQEPWYTPFTGITAFKQLSRQCFIPSWSVANDILFGLVLAPPLILLLQRRPRATLCAMLALICVCVNCALRYYVEAEPELRWQIAEARAHGLLFLVTGLSYLYTWPLVRAPSFLCGMIAGYALFERERRSTDPKRQKDAGQGWLMRAATVGATVFLLVHLLISIFLIELKTLLGPYSGLMSTYGMGPDRTLWAAANAVLFLRMTTDWRNSPLMRAFASPKLRSLARLSYPIIFIHWIFIVVQTNVMTTVPDSAAWQLWTTFAGISLLTVPCAILVHVIFENPIDKLVKREIFGL